MSDKVIVVTSPDDILLQGIRITHVELTEEQSSIVSNALLQTSIPHNIINYVWKMGDPIPWLFDKITKSDLIFFNAEPQINGASELIIGYIAAQAQAHYFGILKDLHLVNNSTIYNSDQIITLLENTIQHHAKQTG